MAECDKQGKCWECLKNCCWRNGEYVYDFPRVYDPNPYTPPEVCTKCEKVRLFPECFNPKRCPLKDLVK